MKNFEIIPTEENLIQALKENILRRNTDLAYFYKLLSSLDTSCTIAIDGRWGSGKTFFVKQSHLLINALNQANEMEDEKRNNITQAIPLQNKNDDIDHCQISVYYDAWENDNDTDPIMSIIYEIAKQLGLNYSFDSDCEIFKMAGSIMEAFTGRNVNAIIDKLKGDNPLSSIKKQKDIQEQIRQFLTKLLEERGNRLVIFIDELDRCKPNYAVQLLERIKHYLCDERISFVLSVNLEQLQHTIKHHYGISFDACRYLDRFFDIRIAIPPADKNMFFEKLGLNSDSIIEMVCKKVIEIYHFELREITRYYCQVKAAIHDPIHDGNDNRWDFSFFDGKAKRLILAYFVPVLIGLKIANLSLYDEFVSGRNPAPLIDIYGSSEIGEWFTNGLLNEGESYTKTTNTNLVTREEKLTELYEAIFVYEYTRNDYQKTLGNHIFNADSKIFARRAESMLSDFSNFQI